VQKAQEYIESNYQDKITTEDLASLLFTDKRNFERRFKKATSNTVGEYVQRVRVEAVKKGLETSDKTIMELMHEVGYADTKAFRAVFKKITGLTPVAYRDKYRSTSVL
jgi:transcriptional regulator GlxA family with amidase domain